MRKNINLDQSVIDRLEHLSAITGMSQSKLISIAVMQAYGEDKFVRYRLDEYNDTNRVGMLVDYFDTLQEALWHSGYTKQVKAEPEYAHALVTVFLSDDSDGELGWENGTPLDFLYFVRG